MKELLALYKLQQKMNEAEDEALQKMDERETYVLIIDGKAVSFSRHNGRVSRSESKHVFVAPPSHNRPACKYREVGAGTLAKHVAINISLPPSAWDAYETATEGVVRRDWNSAQVLDGLERREIHPHSFPKGTTTRKTLNFSQEAIVELNAEARRRNVPVSQLTQWLLLWALGEMSNERS